MKRIFIAIIVSFFLTSILSKTVFYANTPRINKMFIASIINLPNKLINNASNFIASLKPNNSSNQTNTNQARIKQPVNNTRSISLVQSIEQIPITTMTKIGKGVYAKEDKANNVYYLKLTEDTEWDEKEYIVNGEKVTIKFPKGTLK